MNVRLAFAVACVACVVVLASACAQAPSTATTPSAASAASATASLPAPAARASGVLGSYTRVDKLSGSLKAVGSSTVAAMLKQVTDAFEANQPDVSIDVSGSGSGTALTGMLEAPNTMGLLSRPMTPRERSAFQAKYGYAPTEVKLAVDAVGIFVFKDNPVKALSLTQLRRAFGRDADAADRWGALTDASTNTMPIVTYGLERGRGAYELFRDVVLEGGEFAGDVLVEPVSTSVVQGVATQPGGLGYASVFFRSQRTRLLPILHKGEVIEPTADNALSGQYPLARFLYVVVNKKPNVPLDDAQRQFLFFALSRDGQEVIAKQGFFALDGAAVREGVQRVEGLTAGPKPGP
jgi:phosphate transport system substrate-binding protein